MSERRPLVLAAGLRAFGGLWVPERYLDCLAGAGVEVVAAAPAALPERSLGALLGRFDGLLLVGGGDVEPRRYGQLARPEVYGVDERRDSFEMGLVRAALGLSLPLLAVCRGVQLLNVALGGSLHQHLPALPAAAEHRGGEGGVRHRVRVSAGSRLARALGVEEIDALSIHHQAIDRLGRGLEAVAWTADGLVEGVEMATGWVVGVQWHPEMTAAADPCQQRLFGALAEQAATQAAAAGA